MCVHVCVSKEKSDIVFLVMPHIGQCHTLSFIHFLELVLQVLPLAGTLISFFAPASGPNVNIASSRVDSLMWPGFGKLVQGVSVLDLLRNQYEFKFIRVRHGLRKSHGREPDGK